MKCENIPPVLQLDNVCAGYNSIRIINGISLSVSSDSMLAIVGRNGAGKTTLIKTIIGLLPLSGGTISLNGAILNEVPAYVRSRLGLGYVPQGREIFASLTVRENLVAAAGRGAELQDVLELFPSLAGRLDNLGAQLSGGEQQMLAIARSLVVNPKVLLLDEPLEGLAPILIKRFIETLGAIRKKYKTTVVMSEQKVELALKISDRIVVLQRGEIIHQSTTTELVESRERQQQLFNRRLDLVGY